VAIMPVAAGENPAEKRIWQSRAPFYELGIAVIDSPSGAEYWHDANRGAESELLSDRDNWRWARHQQPSQWTAVTQFANPYAGCLCVASTVALQAGRWRGVIGDLYLRGYDKSKGPLPTLMEAYPAEFKSRAAASQVTGSPYEFVRIGQVRRSSSR